MKRVEPLKRGATIGIVGGGQLGRMLAIAAHELGFKTHIFCPDTNTPATKVATTSTCASYEDTTALAQFAKQVDVITYEFENIPIAALKKLPKKRVMPPFRALKIAQDRFLEKKFIRKHGIATTNFYKIKTPSDITKALNKLNGTGILKTRRLGYDGKGQWKITTQDFNAPIDVTKIPCILEAVVPFDREISVLVARRQDGGSVTYDPIENSHQNHILHESNVPANITLDISYRASCIAKKLAEKLRYVGVLAVEFFVQGDTLLVNEIAPRVHNSGHLTQDACFCGQFEQHIHAIAGWGFRDTTIHHDAVMTNLIGGDVHDWEEKSKENIFQFDEHTHSYLDKDTNSHLYIYEKDKAAVGRKMGHITRLMNR